jgi:hypothetical protein
MAVAFWAATGYLFFWAIPWFPGGLSEKDYTGRVALTVILGGVCAVLGIGTLVLRGVPSPDQGGSPGLDDGL